MNQIQSHREYVNMQGTKHRLLAKVATKTGKVTLNKEFLRKVDFFPHDPIKTTRFMYQRSMIGKTFFKEIQIAPPKMTQAVKRYAQNHEPKIGKMSLKTLMKTIERDWDSNKFHVFLHSSGYDGRLISGILMKLREKRGDGWIGDMLFLCWEPDGKHFKNVMNWEGWKNYHVYREGVRLDYRSELVEFKNVWRWVNDYGFPHFVAGPAIEDAQKRGLIPKKDICVVGGLDPFTISNLSTMKLPKPRVRYPNKFLHRVYAKREYRCQWSTVPCESFFFPFLDIEVAKSLIPESKRLSFLKELNKTLYNLPRYPQTWCYRDHGNWSNAPAGLSKETRVKAAKSFNDSWYAKETNQQEAHVAPDLKHGMSHRNDRWWRNYVLASTCEYLVDQGVKIKV